jgi:hypothetical protein
MGTNCDAYSGTIPGNEVIEEKHIRSVSGGLETFQIKQEHQPITDNGRRFQFQSF